MCLEIYELDPAKFLSAPGLARQAALKRSKVKLDLLIDIDMLLRRDMLLYKRRNVSLYLSICKS